MDIEQQTKPFSLREPWICSLLALALIPLFPEYISFVLVIVAAVFAWKDMRIHTRRFRIGVIGKLLLLYTLYMTFTAVYSQHPYNSLATAGMWYFFFVGYGILNNLLYERQRFEAFVFLLTCVGAIVGLIGCCQYGVGSLTNTNPIRLWDWLDEKVYSVLPIALSHTQYKLRVCSTFSNPNILSEYLTMTLPFAIYHVYLQKKARQRTFSYIAVLFIVVGVVLSFSRGGYIALALVLLALVLCNLRRHFAATIVCVFTGLLLMPDKVVDRALSILPGISTGNDIIDQITNPGGSYDAAKDIINSSIADGAINERWHIWLESLRRFRQQPLFGYGAGTQTSWNLLHEHGINAVHTHNIVLQLVIEGGIIALVLMLLIGGKTFKNGIELLRVGRNTPAFWAGFAVLGFAIAFSVQGLVDYPLLTPKLVCHFMLLLGLTERSISLYCGRGIPLRKHLRQRLRKKAVS